MKKYLEKWEIILLIEFSFVGLMSFVGVLLRYHFIRILTIIKNNSPQICSLASESAQSLFYNQPYLISNLLGSFIIALVMNTCLLDRLKSEKQMHSNVIQSLTTGFCGCLTTFASWINQFSTDTFHAHDWFSQIILLFIEFALCWTCYQLGVMISMMINSIVMKKINLSTVFFKKETAHIPIQQQESPSHSIELVNLHMESNVELYNNDTIEEHGQEQGQTQEKNQEQELSHKLTIFHQIRIFILLCFWIVWIILWIFVIIDIYSPFNSWDSSFRVGIRAVTLSPFGSFLRYIIKKLPHMATTVPRATGCTFLCNMIGVLLDALFTHYSYEWTWKSSFTTGMNDHNVTS